MLTRLGLHCCLTRAILFLEGSLGLKCYVCDKCANGGVGELQTCPEGAQGSCVIEITKSQKPELEGESSLG